MRPNSIAIFSLILAASVCGKNVSADDLGNLDKTRISTIATPVIVNLVLTTHVKSPLPEDSGSSFLKGIKVVVLLSYLGLVSVIVSLSLRRRKLVDHFENLKRQNLNLSDELEKKINLCSALSTQTNIKARELTSCALSIIQKHNVLALVNKELQTLEDIFTAAPLIDSPIAMKFKSLTERSTSDNRNYWEDFLFHFQLLYPNYLVNIRLKSSSITDKELKLAALLRLGLDTKKIAALLNLSPVSIKVFRHRLRKKLELPEDVNLYNYLSHFDN